jgi:RHS repeat-associated protein
MVFVCRDCYCGRTDLLESLGYDFFKRGLVEKSSQSGGDLNLSTLATFDEMGRTVISRDPAGYSSKTRYDIEGRVLGSTDAMGATTASAYDRLGRSPTSRDALGRAGWQEYDDADRVTNSADALGNVTTMTYDAAGNMLTRTDALGKVTTYSYDALGRQVGSIDALLRVTTTTYDALGNVATVSDYAGRITAYEYDALNRVVKTTYAVGTAEETETETVYDAVGNVVASKDARGFWTTFTYDALNRRVGTLDAAGQQTTTVYNAVGNVTESMDALGESTFYEYDGLHRQVVVENALGHKTTSVLDARGQSVQTVDALGKVTYSFTDAVGRVIGKRDAENALAATVYDASGATRLLTDALGNEWKYEYDPMGRERVRIDPLGARTTTTYDELSRVSEVQDRLNRTIAYAYDDGNRLVQEVWQSNSAVTLNVITYAYDGNNNRTSVQDNAGSLSYNYDALNRLTSFTNVFGAVLTYAYDNGGNITSRVDSLGGTLTSTYDALGRLATRTLGTSLASIQVEYAYTDRSQVESITRRANGNLIGTATYGHDALGRLTTITNANASSATISQYGYAYDNLNRVTTHTYDSAIGTYTYNGVKTYTYDHTSQVIGDTGSAYSYDAQGNRTMLGYATGAANRLTNDGVFTYAYDAEGNRISKSKGSGLETWYYTWDNRNCLIGVEQTSDGVNILLAVTYTYDANDKLVAEEKWQASTGVVVTRRHWDGEDLWAITDASNVVAVRYLYGDGVDQVQGRIVEAGPNAGTQGFYATDHLGSVRDIIDAATGDVLFHAEYDAFGVATEYGAGYGDTLKYTAREFDADTGLQYNRARWYDNSTGRWLSEDPIGFAAGDHNLYRYVSNFSTGATDPSGLKVYLYMQPIPLPFIGLGTVAYHVTIYVGPTEDGKYRTYDGGGVNSVDATGRPQPSRGWEKALPKKNLYSNVISPYKNVDDEIGALDKVFAKLNQLPYARLGPNSNTYANQLLTLAGFMVVRESYPKRYYLDRAGLVKYYPNDYHGPTETWGWYNRSYGTEYYDDFGNEK